MFTGIVSDVGTVVERTGSRLALRAPLLADTSQGASVAVDGCCLTVTTATPEAHTFDLSAETLARTTLGERHPGDSVNLERPLVVGAELGGHLVQGHVDGVGRVLDRDDLPDGSRTLRVGLDPELARYLVEKGSVTVDGVSLTVVTADEAAFEVAVVPHTLKVTTLGEAAPGRAVNVEVDVLAKYVARLLVGRRAPGEAS